MSVSDMRESPFDAARILLRSSGLLFVIGPGPRAGCEIVNRRGTVLVGFHVDEHRGVGRQRLAKGRLELRGIIDREALRPEGAGKGRPVVIGNAGGPRG